MQQNQLPYNCLTHLDQISQQLGTQNKIAVIDNTNSITYSELYTKAKRFGCSLLNCNIKHQEHIIICLEDSIDFIVCFLGSIYAGIIPVVINPNLSNSEIHQIVVKSPANNVICSKSRANDFCQKEWNLILIPDVITGNSVDRFIGQQYNTKIEPTDTYENDDAFIYCTSGTTGHIKLVVHSQKSICGTGLQYGTSVISLNKNDVVFSAAKLSHAYGLGNSISIPFVHGCTVVLESSLATPETIVKLIETNKVTTFCGVPRHFTSLLNTSRQYSLDTLKVCLSAGESLPQKVGKDFTNRYKCVIINAIGSTEILGFALSTRSDDIAYGSTGTVVDGCQVKLMDDYGNEVKQGQLGELFVHSEYSSKKYWNDESSTQYTFIDGWIKTNDMYMVNTNGHYVHKGRKNDCMKVNGLYVSLTGLEKDLYEVDSILDAAVVFVENKYGLNKIELHIVLKDNFNEDIEYANIQQHFNKHELLSNRPFTIKIIDALPRTQSGKIKKYVLLNRD